MMKQTIREALARASSLLDQKNINPKIADWIMLHHTRWNRTQLVTRMEEPLSAEVWSAFDTSIHRVLEGEPYQYVIGIEEFYGRQFKVHPDVLIPRPETEELVEHVLRAIRGKDFSSAQRMKEEIRKGLDRLNRRAPVNKHSALNIVDVGTGSGVIAITLALELEKAQQHALEQDQTQEQEQQHRPSPILATDISHEALQMAQQNAQLHAAHIRFFQGDLLQPLIEQQIKVDVIVSNPPYIADEEKDSLAKNVVDYEPHTALFAKDDGLYCYKKIIQQSQEVLRPGGLIAFEVGLGQAQIVKQLLADAYPQGRQEIKEDLRGIERIVLCYT